MAKNSIRDFSATAASNTDIQSVDIDENCAASGINNAIRELMADLKDVSTGTVALETPAADQLNVDNLRLDGNTISSTNTNGDITLDPNGTGDTIFASGKVGIGTSSPQKTVEVFNNADQQIRLRNGALATQSYDVGRDGGTGLLKFYGNQSGYTGYIFDGADGERLRITSGGNVGIGTSDNLDEKLVVQGTSIANSMVVTRNNNTNSSGKYGFYTVGHYTTAEEPAALIAGESNASNNEVKIGGGFGEVNAATLLRFFTAGNTTTTNGTERLRINSGGQILTGSLSFDSGRANSGTLCLNASTSGVGECQLQIKNPANVDGTLRNYVLFYTNGGTIMGSIQCNTTSTSYNTTSDHRLKENVADMTGAITRVKALAPKRFNFIVDADRTVDGFLAHEAQTVVPEAVTGTHNEVETWTQQEIDDGDAPDGTSAGDNKLDGDGNTIPVMQGIDQSKLVPLLTGALQEAIAKIETLETEMTALKARVTALEA